MKKEKLTQTDSRWDVGSLEYRLSKFNAKERFALIQRILGVHFVPHADFLKEVLKECDIEAAPGEVFCAMDFHLDWLYAALMRKDFDTTEKTLLDADAVTGKQQDVDFLLCFTDKKTEKTHLILIEAKGVGSWDTKQIRSKCKQYMAMRRAFEQNPEVEPRFVLMSRTNPLKSEKVQTAKFLAALKELKGFKEPVWLQLGMETTYAVVRCDRELVPTKKGPTHWRLVERRGS